MKIENSPFHILFLIMIVISLVTIILFFSSYRELSFAQTDDEEQDKLIVKARINLTNIDLENTKFIRVIGFINGEESKQDIPISSIDKTKKRLDVELKVNRQSDIVKADYNDKFFVCAYQVGNNTDGVATNNFLPKFDCKEGDLLHIHSPTQINLFGNGSQVYSKSQGVYAATLNANNNNNNNNNNNKTSDTVKIKVIAPLEDRKHTHKLIITAMVKGQIQSEVIEDVKTELDKTKDYKIKKTFTFDRNTDIGQIQIGDRFHACVSSDDLRPPEGTECEKRLIKQFDLANSLPAR